jgi:hypothetical protein
MAICVVTKKEGIMEKAKLAEIMALKDKTLPELKTKYNELYGSESTQSSNKVYLWRKIAYKLQEVEHGGLSGVAQGKIEEFIHKYDPVNNKALRPGADTVVNDKRSKIARDKRLPIPGTIITKEYKGTGLEVRILDKGFEYNNKQYKSLTAIAKEVTGAHWNGYLFFGL